MRKKKQTERGGGLTHTHIYERREAGGSTWYGRDADAYADGQVHDANEGAASLLRCISLRASVVVRCFSWCRCGIRAVGLFLVMMMRVVGMVVTRRILSLAIIQSKENIPMLP